jgi:dTDP-4-amino-4,6-dideoxy-D-galactose acyltransferase
MTTDVCEYLPWDSEFFGVRIARVNGNRIDAPRLAAINDWCNSNAIECLYLLADANDAQTVRVAEGFVLTDIRVRFELPLTADPPVAPGMHVRPFRAEDVPALRAVAGASHRDSRFYYDEHFDRSRCDELYRTWLQRSTEGWADAVFVADWEGSPAGYISCHLSGTDGSIGLIAVHPEARGRGLAGQLVKSALAYFSATEMKRALVVTQGRNIASQRLYQKCGFITESVQLWFHRWFPRSRPF